MIIKKNILVIATVLALGATANANSADLRFSKKPVQGQYIVVLKDNVAALSSEKSSAPRVSDIANLIGTLHGVKVTKSFNHALRGFVVTANDKSLARLLMDSRIAYIEEDGYMYASATQTGATWGIDRVDQRARPLDNSYTYNTTASNVHAYIIDTGVLGSHTQFTGRMGNGYTAITDANGTNDCNGHGTHVAGTVGGTTYGVAKSVIIHPVRVLGCTGSGTNSGVIAGMDWVTANHVKPAVANMSLGGGASTATDDAVARMTAAGVTVAVAAGNDNGDACSYSPARAPSAITVGSTTSTDARSSFSNFGTCLDIYGPGSSILSSWYTSTTATNTISGTSMASPHVAGAAALYLAVNPSATPAQVVAALRASATTGVVTDAKTGSPNLLLYTLGGTTPPPSGSQTYTNTADYAIGDNTTVDSPITVSGRTGNALATTSVTVAIVHTYQGDLKVDLVAPDGSLYNIHNRTGAGTDNISKTVTLNLSTELLNGTWKLRVNDNAGGDIGYINSWSVTF